jgi:hypothetical protein
MTVSPKIASPRSPGKSKMRPSGRMPDANLRTARPLPRASVSMKKMENSPRFLAKVGAEKPERVFEIPAPSLEGMGIGMHAFRPDDPRQELHSRETTMGES